METKEKTLWEKLDEPWNHTLIQHPCNHCEKPVEIEQYLIDHWGGVSCNACCDAYDARQGVVDDSKYKMLLRDLIPPIYEDFNASKYPQESMENLRKVVSWKPGSQGMYIMGDTRKGKTRAVMELVKRLVNDMKVDDITIIWMGELKDKITDLANERNRLAYKNELKNTNILIMDDIFNDSMTEGLGSFIFSVMDHRLNYKKPTIISSNLTGSMVKDLGSEKHRANAMYQRIKESCEVVWFK